MEIKTSWLDLPKEHSESAEMRRNQFTLWIKVKDRYSGKVITSNQLEEIRNWLIDNDIDYEKRRDWSWSHLYDQQLIRYANQYYVAIFPNSESQMNAIKIVWGEHLSSRLFLNVPKS